MKVIRQCKRWRSCPLCLSGQIGVINHQAELNSRYFELRRKESETVPIKKPDSPAPDGGVSRSTREGDDWVLYPTLMEYLTEDRYEDGSSRRTSTVTLFAQDGQVKGCVNDRDNDCSAFFSAASIESLLAVIESKLKESSADWRRNQGGSKRRSR